MRSWRPNLLLRAVVLLVMALAIGAPSPGYVGGCQTSSGGVEPSEFCRQFQSRVCARDRAAGRIDEAGYSSCVAQIDPTCSGFNFAAGCNPTQSTAEACYSALVDPTRVGIPATLGMRGLDECIALCSGSGGGGLGEGDLEGEGSSGGGIDPEGI